MKTLSLAFVAALFGAIVSACATTGIAYEKKDDAPDLPERGAGCHVEIMESGRSLEHQHPFEITGTLVWKLSGAELSKHGGEESIQKRIIAAACKYGLFVVTDIKAYPDSQRGGATYEAKGGVLVDKDGEPITTRRNPNDAPEEPAEAPPEG